jgi:hypothetical protein
MSVSGSKASVVPSSGGVVITTSKAFNSSGGEVATNTGEIPESWVSGEATITSVIFANDNSVTGINAYAFVGCTGLTSITIPDSVTFFYAEAFSSCTNITSINIPNSVTLIDTYVFGGCSSLATVFCYVQQSVFIASDAFDGTASPLTIRVPTTGAVSDTWTAGTGLTFQGNTNVTVIKNL